MYKRQPEGIATDEKIDFLLRIRGENKVKLEDYAKTFGVKFYPKEKPWKLKGDIAFPSATENEIDIEEAKELTKNGIKYVFEGQSPLTFLCRKYNCSLSFRSQFPNNT